jgi:hypothetical protein
VKAAVIGLFFLLWCCSAAPATDLPGFAVARNPVPVYNTPAAALPGTVLTSDGCGQARELEFIALPGTVFKLIATLPGTPSVLQVTTAEYQPPSGTVLYCIADLLELHTTKPPERKCHRPEMYKIIQRLESAAGLPYIWGGNLREGVLRGPRRHFAGLDCSGLLYEATGGYTPRNTEQLVQFGTAVPVAGLGVEELAQRLRPLDLIVWKGHVIIVLDQEHVIESILNCHKETEGVIITPLKERLAQLVRQRRPADGWPQKGGAFKIFVVRRWF